MDVSGPKKPVGEPGKLAEPVFFNQNSHHDYTSNSLKDAEEQVTVPHPPANQSRRQPKKRLAFVQKFAGKRAAKSPILLILLLIFGGTGAIGLVLAPGIAIMQGSEILRKDTNSLLSAYTKTDQQLWRAKLSSVSGDCKIKVCSKFKTVNIKKNEKMFKRAGIELEFDKSAGWGEGRGRITKMTHVDERGNTTTITSPKQLDNAMKHNLAFRSAMMSAYNPTFTSLKDAPAIKFLKKMKTSYAKKLTGNSDKELDKNMSDAVDGKVSVDFSKLRPEKDDKGNDTGRYLDENGNVYDKETVNQLKTTEDRLTNAPTSGKMLDGLAKGALITSYIDTACTVYNTSRAVELSAKVIRQREMIRYAMIFLNTADAMKAGDATPEQVEYLGKKLTDQDMRQKIVDESAWDKAGTKDNPPMVDNPNYRKSGLDATFFKMSAYQDTPHITSREVRFMAGGTGLTGTLASVNQAVAKTLGTSSPKELHQRCKIVQNPLVRGGALVIGIAAGVGSLGWSTALGIAGSLAFAFALPYLTSMLADIVAGRVTGPDLTGTDMMNAVAIGASSMQNGNAREHGLMPLTPDQMVEYQNSNRQVQVANAETEAYAARSVPFDISNQYSFLGSLARTLTPLTLNTTSSGMAMFNLLPSTLAVATSSLLPTSSAMVSQKINPERYTTCNDPAYKEMNVAADPTCVLLYGLPKEAMEIDPLVNAQWMADHDEINPDSATGEPKDNKRDWNYKKYIDNCIDQQPGAHENPDEEDNNGAECADPKYFTQNWHYAKFYLTMTISDGQDGNLPGVDGGSQSNFSNGESGMVSQSGWAYPTTADASITSPFGPRGGSQHRGTDLVPANGAIDKPIFAARDGEVVAAGPASGFGNWIVIKSTVDGKRYDTVYGHMFDNGVFVKVGDKVKAGQQIGKIGYNGEVSPPGPGGAHLHFEVWEGGHNNFVNGGKAIDPAPILRNAHDNPTSSNEVRL